MPLGTQTLEQSLVCYTLPEVYTLSRYARTQRLPPMRHTGWTTKFAQSELDPTKQKAGYHRHGDTLPLLVYCSAYSCRRTCRGKAPPSANADRSVAQTPHWGVCCCHKRKPPIIKKRTRTLSRKELGSSTNCMVDGTGLEPVTSCTSSRCSTS